MAEIPALPPDVLLDVRGLTKLFPPRRSLFQRKTANPVRAVEDVSFAIRQGETLGLVGESGCGKSTVTRLLLGIHQPTAGTMRYRRKDGGSVDLDRLSEDERLAYCTDLRIVFQDPQSSLNPRLQVRDIVGEVLKVN